MIAFHAIFARKHGEANGYPVMVAFDEVGRIAVYAKFEELRGPAGDTFRSEHAEAQLINNLDVETEWNFLDPATVEAERKARALIEARAVRASNEAAQRELSAAKDRASEARSSFKDLSDEQKDLLAEADAKDKAAAASNAEKEKAEQEAASELEREGAALAAKAQKILAEGATTEGMAAISAAIAEQDKSKVEPVVEKESSEPVPSA